MSPLGGVFITDICQRIFSILAKKGLKSADLSRGTGLSSGMISDWKNKNINPATDKISRIAEFLEVSTDLLLTGKENSPPSLRDDELELLKYYNALPVLERGRVLARMEDKANDAEESQGRVG